MYNESTLTVYNHNRITVGDGAVNYVCAHAYRSEEPGKLRVQAVGSDKISDCQCNAQYYKSISFVSYYI